MIGSNHVLQLPAAATLVPRDIRRLSAAAAAELCFSFGSGTAMRERYVEIVKRLRLHSLGAFPRATKEMLDAAEVELGFRLPSLLRAVYRFVGNGGFGPGVSGGPIGGGLIGVGGTEPYLSTAQPIEDLYQQRIRETRDLDRRERWPRKVVPFCDYGCASYACVDCSSPSARVLYFDSDASLGDRNVFRLESRSLAKWWEEWLRKKAGRTKGGR